MLDLSRQFAPLRQEILDAIAQVCDSQAFILGPRVAAFEAATAAACAASFAVGCASGTDALWLALAALKIAPGDVVITSPFSFFATASCILRAGGTPVFVDIDERTFNLSPSALEYLLRHPRWNPARGAFALMPVHLYGQCADMTALNELAKADSLDVVEDAAQAFGALWDGHPAGSLGDAAAFSFYPTKNLSAFGDAGLLTTSHPQLAAHARSLRSHGMTRRYYHDEVGWNSRLDAIQAAVLEVKLRYVPQWNQQRRDRAARYDHLFREAGLAAPSRNQTAPLAPPANQAAEVAPPAHETSLVVGWERGASAPRMEPAEPVGFSPGPPAPPSTTVSTEDGIVLPYTDPRATHVFHQYVIRAPRRDALRDYLTTRGIGSEIYYPVPLHLQAALKDLGYKPGDFPHAERAAAEVLALPIFPELREDEQRTVVDTIRRFYA